MGTRTSLACEPGVSAAVGCGVLCIVFRGPHRSRYPDDVVDWTERALEYLDVEKVPTIIIIEDHAESPDVDSRRRYADGLALCAPKMEAHAQVILSQGLKGAAFRAISSTIFLLSRSTGSSKVFGDVTHGVRWIVESTQGCSVSPEVLLAFVESVRTA